MKLKDYCLLLLAVVVVVVVINCCIISVSCVRSATPTLDYSLYSQLAVDLEIEEGEQAKVLNYFRVLNSQSLSEFNDYLFFSDVERVRLKNLAKSMFEFGYDNYMKFAFPLDELNPIYCRVCCFVLNLAYINYY